MLLQVGYTGEVGSRKRAYVGDATNAKFPFILKAVMEQMAEAACMVQRSLRERFPSMKVSCIYEDPLQAAGRATF